MCLRCIYIGRVAWSSNLELEYNMVVIRLARGGAKARPFFNIVVADKRTRRDGRFIERIGFYNPIATEKEESIRIAQDRLTYWKGVGAQASPTVDRLIAQAAAKSPVAA
jgi:small subunit ribosomal protein S16